MAFINSIFMLIYWHAFLATDFLRLNFVDGRWFIMQFHDRLKYLRCAKIPTITQKDLANALGITQRKVSFLETGTTEPSLKDIVALCKYFNVSADFLLGLPNNMNYPE